MGQTLAHHLIHLIWKSICTRKTVVERKYLSLNHLSVAIDRKSFSQEQSNDIMHNDDQRIATACEAVFDVDFMLQAFEYSVRCINEARIAWDLYEMYHVAWAALQTCKRCHLIP